MALRPIDDAISMTADTNQLQQLPPVKVVVDIQIKQSDFVGSGENKYGLLSSANGDAVVDYIFSGGLKPIADLKVEIQNLVEELQSKDWIKVFDSLNNARRFALFQFVLLIPFFRQSNSGVDGGIEESEECIMQEFIMASADLFHCIRRSPSMCPNLASQSDTSSNQGKPMNPLTLVKRIQKINSRETDLGISEEASWHAKYKGSA
ncbi:hypothetical protein Dimus_032523 [Dionaea muscipula]